MATKCVGVYEKVPIDRVEYRFLDNSGLYVRFKSPDYSSQIGKRFTKQNKKVLNSLNHKIFRRASKLLQSHWPRRYFLSLHISKQKIICKSILS